MGAETKRQRELERKIEGKRIFLSVNAVLACYGLTSQVQLTVAGDPAGQILKVADERGMDLIAMGVPRAKRCAGRVDGERLTQGAQSCQVPGPDCAHPGCWVGQRGILISKLIGVQEFNCSSETGVPCRDIPSLASIGLFLA